MRSPRVTTDYDESRPLDAVPEADRWCVAEKKLWRVRSILETDLRVAADYLAELQQFDAWRLFKCGSMAEFVEQRGLRLDDELVAAIRSRLQPAPPAHVVEELAGDESVVDALRDRAFRIAQAGRETARALADTIERLHDYAGPGGWRLVTRPDGSKFDTFREYAAYRNPPGLGFNEHDGAADVDAIVSRLIAFDPNRLAIAYLRGNEKPVATKRYPRDTKTEDARSTADVLVELVDASALLDELKAAGVRVEARGDRLRLLPASAVDEALVARVRPHKAGLLALLEARSRPAVADPIPPAATTPAATTPTACEPLKHEPEPAGRDDRGWTRYVCRKCGRFYCYAPDAPAALQATLKPTYPNCREDK